MKRKSLIICAIMLTALLSACNFKDDSSLSEDAGQQRDRDEEVSTSDSANLTQEVQKTLIEIESDDNELVCVADYIPDIIIDLRYATTDNFTGQILYDFSDAWLRYGTVQKLLSVQSKLKESGYCLKIWDAYRPVAIQFKLWEVVPDPTWVANPYSGYSTHSNGGTVDITMVRQDGALPEMPTEFDDFSPNAHRDYSNISDEARTNAELLEEIMEEAGFEPYTEEWWHYSDKDNYPYEDLEQIPFTLNRQSLYEPGKEESISLRNAPNYDSEQLAEIARDATFSVLGWSNGFARIEYQGQQGYVPIDDIQVK